jgi:DeoR/GlpR family transcriptional regulator of sugar metabolism
MKRNLEAAVSQIVLNRGPQKVVSLARELEVSGVTIRKVLSALETKGVVRRYHGEARAAGGDDIPFRMGSRFDDKNRIAALAATFVEPGDTVFLEAGSTVSLLADLIKGHRNLTVITPNLFIARLFRGTGTRVIVLGGLYQEGSESLVGAVAKNALAELTFSKAFLGVTGFTRATGFTLNDSHRAELSQAILAKGAVSFVLTDSSKFGASHAAPLCTALSKIHTVITDPSIPEDDERFLTAAGIRVLKA